MATDIKGELIRALNKALPRVSAADEPDATFPTATPLPARMVEQIAEGLSRRGSPLDQPPSAESFPLLARLKPRGYWEDHWSARPSSRCPWPVILLHGTGATPGAFELLGEELRAAGWAVFAPAYGHRATDSLEQSVAQIDAYIRAVLQVTGAAKAVIVGHSQGGLLARWWAECMGGAQLARHIITLSAPHQGTTRGGILSQTLSSQWANKLLDTAIDRIFGAAGTQQIQGSAFLEVLRQTPPSGVGYTCIATHFDSVVQPPESAFLDATGSSQVRNIWVQEVNPRAAVTHDEMTFHPIVRELVRACLRALN